MKKQDNYRMSRNNNVLNFVLNFVKSMRGFRPLLFFSIKTGTEYVPGSTEKVFILPVLSLLIYTFPRLWSSSALASMQRNE